jgi:ASC-1-like (ASCH) protein
MSKKVNLRLEAVKTGEFEVEVEVLSENEVAVRITDDFGAIKVIDVEQPKTLRDIFESSPPDEFYGSCGCEACTTDNSYDELDEPLDKTSYNSFTELLEEQAYEKFKRHMARWENESR